MNGPGRTLRRQTKGRIETYHRDKPAWVAVWNGREMRLARLKYRNVNRRNMRAAGALAAALAASAADLHAQIVAWDFNGAAGNESTINATTNNTSLNTSVISRGGGLLSSALVNAYSSQDYTASGTEANSVTNNDYQQFTISAKPGNQFSLSTLDANFRRSGTGPNAFRWQYSLNGFATAGTNINGTAISYTLTNMNGDAQTQLSLSGISALQSVTAGTTVTIRLYGWGASATGGTFALGRLAGNDLALGGSVSAITGPLYWDLNGSSPGVGGTGPNSPDWDTTSLNWNTSSGGTNPPTFYSSAAVPTFAGTPTTVSIAAGGVSANAGVDFQVDGYTIQSNSLTIGAPGMTVSGNTTITSAITLGASQSWTIASNKVLTIGGNVTNGANTLTLTGAGGLTRNGTGDLVLNGANTYTGDTTITSGKVLLNGTHTGAGNYAINGGTFGGSSTNLTLASGKNVVIGNGVSSGTVAPGSNGNNSIGKLTLNTSGVGVTDFRKGGTYAWELNAQSGTAGQQWDLLDLEAVTASAGAGEFTIKIISLSASNANANGPVDTWNPFPPGGARFTIATSTNSTSTNFDSITGLLAKFTIDASSFQNFDPLGWRLETSNGGMNLDLVYIPEPTTGLAAALGLLSLARRRRRASLVRD